MSEHNTARHQMRANPIIGFRLFFRTPLIPILLGSLLFAAGCNNSSRPLNPAATATNASVSTPAAPQPATVTQRDIVGQVVLNGQIVVPPSARADLNPSFRAVVNKVDRNVGAEVEQGDVLVELAMPSAEAYHEQTRLALKDAESAYANAQQEYQASVDAAQKQLDAARAAAKAAGSAATSGGSASASGNSAASGDAASTSGDTTSGNPATDANQAIEARTAAAQALLQAKADRAAQLLPYKQQVAQAEEANRQASATERQKYIRTPITGTVMVLNAQPAKEVVPNVRTPVATVIDLHALQVQSPMTPQQAGYVKPGMDVTLTFDEIPEKTFEGTVYRMTSQPNNQGYVAILKFTNTAGHVKPDMKPHVAIKTGKVVKNVLAVPSTAVRIDSTGKPFVTIMRDGNWQQVAVDPGLSDMQFTEIKSGLKQGETVQVIP